MMLLERWVVAAMLGIGLVWTAGGAPGQSSAKPQAKRPRVVQPDQGAPPDQAVQPDQNAPLDPGMPPDQAVPQEPDPPPNQESAVPPPNQEPAVPPPPQAVATPKPAAPDQEPAATPEPEPVATHEPAAMPAAATSPAPPELAPRPVTAEQAQLQRDTAHLLQLVQELKVEVEKAGSNTLSLPALRKADEIQRIARNLKERMKERGPAPTSKP